MEETKPIEQNLNENIVELSGIIKQTNSLKFIFLRGVVNGVGTFIGATVVAAVAITIVIQILGVLDIDLGIRDYLNSLLPKAN